DTWGGGFLGEEVDAQRRDPLRHDVSRDEQERKHGQDATRPQSRGEGSILRSPAPAEPDRNGAGPFGGHHPVTSACTAVASSSSGGISAETSARVRRTNRRDAEAMTRAMTIR